jgi:hypothetical protein
MAGLCAVRHFAAAAEVSCAVQPPPAALTQAGRACARNAYSARAARSLVSFRAAPPVATALTRLRTRAGIPCVCNEVVGEVSRGVRAHFPHFVKQLEEHTWRDAQRGLAHSYSRAKVKFNVNRVDNMIIQARALLLGVYG